MFKISASILTADFSKLGEEIKRVEDAGVDMLHIDVMDGMYVPNITIGIPVVKSIRKTTRLPFDVHLMIEKPERYVEAFAEAGADILTIHAEASVHLQRTLRLIKSCNMRAGVALNPSTPLESIKWLLDDLDMVLQMTVNPGFGGQKYIPAMTEKLSELWEMIKDRDLDVDIQVDGGINHNTISKVTESGANVLVMGAALFNAENMKKTVDELRGIAKI